MFKLKEDTTHLDNNLKKGEIVYKLRGHDYGLARDDSIYFGEEFISVSRDGDYPSFTCPIRLLEVINDSPRTKEAINQ